MDLDTPLWVTLLVAALGVAGTLAAALLSSSAASRREAERAREEVNRESERARDQVDRETRRWQEQADRAEARRWLEDRRSVYSAFLIAASRWERYVTAKRQQRVDRNGGVVPIDASPYEDAMDLAYANVQIVGGPATHEAAHAVYHALVMAMVHLEATHLSVSRLDEAAQAAREHLADFLGAVRTDLDIDRATPLTA